MLDGLNEPFLLCYNHACVFIFILLLIIGTTRNLGWESRYNCRIWYHLVCAGLTSLMAAATANALRPARETGMIAGPSAYSCLWQCASTTTTALGSLEAALEWGVRTRSAVTGPTGRGCGLFFLSVTAIVVVFCLATNWCVVTGPSAHGRHRVVG